MCADTRNIKSKQQQSCAYETVEHLQGCTSDSFTVTMLIFQFSNFFIFFFSYCCILRDDKYTHKLQSGEECNSAEGLCFHQQFHQQGLHVSSSSPPSTSSSSPFRFELASVAVYCRKIPLFFLVATVKINDNMKGESVFTRT